MPPALVRPPTPFLGRAADLAAISRTLAADARLITITGPGGIGKTRLALELALHAGSTGTAVYRADLAEARSAEAVSDALALALDLAGDASPANIAHALALHNEALIILDDFDAANAFAPETVGLWLAAAPEATFIVTSRERLRIPGEIVHELAPLSLPTEANPLEASDAVTLFIQAARRVRHDYVATPVEAPFIAALVRELDGLPLAIELAAARMAVMGARALLHRMRSRFDVLKQTTRGAPRRHATLEATVDVSWTALAPHEQDALAQCSVFRGGFSLEAAEAVIDISPHPNTPPPLTIIEALRDKSLLHATKPHGIPGELRLGMYATIRDFAAARLSPDAARAAERRHADHTVAAAERWSQGSGRNTPERRARVLAERDNLLAIIERVLGRGPVTARAAEPALRALLVLAPALLHEGPLEAYVKLIDPALAATRDSGADPLLSANALAVRGALLRQRGEGRAASRDLVQALALARTLGDRALEARATCELGHALAGRGEIAAALDHYERAEALHRAAGDRAAAGDALGSHGALLARQGRLDEAAPLLERALAVHRAEESPIAEAADLRALARLALDAGRLDDARAFIDEAARVAGTIPDKPGAALARGLAGLHADLAGDTGAAREAYQTAGAELGALGFVALEAVHTGRLGVLCRAEGKNAEAFTLLRAARDALDEDADVVHASVFLAHAAALDADVGRTADARAAIDRAAALSARAGDAASRAVLAIARAHLDRGLEGEAIAEARAASSCSADARLALRCFERSRAAGAKPVVAPPDDALLVGPRALWFRAPGGARVALDRRRPLALLLDRLADERAARPGAPLAWDALLAAAWPGERVLAAAGAHRVRVAVSTLRKLGLRDVLRTTEEGYLLAPDVPAVRVD